MNISEAILKKRDRDSFDGGFEAALDEMTPEEERSVEHRYGKAGVSAVRQFLAYRRNGQVKGNV